VAEFVYDIGAVLPFALYGLLIPIKTTNKLSRLCAARKIQDKKWVGN